MPKKFQEGEIYYRVTYGDVKLLYPEITTFVFVGKNLSDEDAEESWYFQFADSYSKFGSIKDSVDGDRRVSIIRSRELAEMLDAAELLTELNSAKKRRYRSRPKSRRRN